MRVLLVTGAYFPELSSGGLQSRAVAARLRDRAAFEVLTTATTASLPAHATVDGVAVARVHVTIGSRWSALVASLRMVRALARALPRVDLVHVQGYSAKNIVLAAMCRLYQKPLVMHLQTSRHDEPAAVREQGRFAWRAFSSASLYLGVSPGLIASYLQAGLPAGRIREVPNGVDAARFTPASAAERQALRQRLQLPIDRPLVLFVGVMMPDKQPDVLLDAWLQVRRTTGVASTLVFVGASNPALYELADGLVDRVRAAADASGYGSEVLFVAPTAAIEDYFRAADVFAMPSAREGLPIVLLEAMACGLPAVASQLPGSTDTMIESGVNGMLVPSGDAKALAGALTTMLSQPAEAARMGEAARLTVAGRYTIEHVAEQWLDAYQQLLTKK